MRNHNLFQGHLWVLIPPCTGGSWHHRELSFTGADVHSRSPWPFTASQWLFLSPLKEIICPPLQTPACLPTAPCHFKGTGFFCVNWFLSSPFSAFLLLLQLPAVFAFCSQTVFAGQTLKLCLSLPSSMTPLMSTQKNPGNSQGTSSIIKSSACLWVSFQQSYHSSRKSQLRL